MDRNESFEHLSDIGKGMQLVGIAITSLIAAAGFVDAKMDRSKRRQGRRQDPTRTDRTVVDMPHKTTGN